MPPLDDEIDQLYQVPLDAFTRARNALAKRAGGAEGAAIKALVKPQRPAWVVNQLYWRHRETFDRLVKASAAGRAAHRRLVAGAPVDLHATEAAHREVLAQARDDARSVLRDAGEDFSPAMLGAVTDTLRALPTADPQGRLTHPLSPTSGVEAFAGVALRASGTGVPHLPPAPVLRTCPRAAWG